MYEKNLNKNTTFAVIDKFNFNVLKTHKLFIFLKKVFGSFLKRHIFALANHKFCDANSSLAQLVRASDC